MELRRLPGSALPAASSSFGKCIERGDVWKGLSGAAAGLIKAQDGRIVLSATMDAPGILILDYSVETEGIPEFEVVSASGDTSVFQITYSESEAALGRYMGDGPLSLAAAMDTYRVNSYNISAPGQSKNRLIKGASVTRSTTSLQLARTVQPSEIPKNSIPEFWQVSSEGVLIESQAPQAAIGITVQSSTTHALEFKAKPSVGGFGFSVLSDTLNSTIYISVNVAEGTIAVHSDSTTKDTLIQKVALPTGASSSLDGWHQVQAHVVMTDINATINRATALKLSQFSKFFGSHGIRASYGHRTLFRDLKVTDATCATTYEHPLTDSSCFKDFLVGKNPLDTSADATRRDRIASTGDLDIAGAAALTNTHGLDSLALCRAPRGFFVPTAKMFPQPRFSKPLGFDRTGLIGYSWNLLTAVAMTYTHTGYIEFAETWAPKAQRMLDWSHSHLLPKGLFNLTGATFGGDWNYYDPAQSGVVTKVNVIYAYALQETSRLLTDGGVDASVSQDRLSTLRSAINTQLWSDELVAYVISETNRDSFAQDSNALAILTGVNKDPARSSELILKTLLKQLSTPHGPVAFSSGATSSGFKRYISSYTTSYHLRGALTVGNAVVARELLSTLWTPMIQKDNANYTGCFWETLNDKGEPAFGFSTSLANGPIEVRWNFCGDLLKMTVQAPAGTKATITLPSLLLVSADASVIHVDGAVVHGTSFEVEGGAAVRITQSLNVELVKNGLSFFQLRIRISQES
ncbi:glycoside hydrolase family 78 protein [Microdochium trichocladiopsis]|uniref:Glycoside hydrolase family 78 protein n=1 Tax=Microdochium trichocladiopsis TaxID=1682393 RepID=A0A9P8XV42_9PEZI|nr:glycoside hydrolase family 78 protein [Microdochium trichocladiopsis]KAH7020719.1 glycoside hydrolase family 78 protein [Microdochium trichocladiopsis]